MSPTRHLPFAEPEAAQAHTEALRRLGATDAFWRTLSPALRESANPDRVLGNLERLVTDAQAPVALLEQLAADPHLLESLARTFAGSQFLTGILLRHPAQGLAMLSAEGVARKTTPEYRAEALAAAAGSDLPPFAQLAAPDGLDVLRRYQHGELLRIGAADLTGRLDLLSVTRQLSRLADAVIGLTLDACRLRAGSPQDGFAVLALGKLGGHELNYSSDVDLIFLASGDASESRRLGHRLLAALSESTSEGFLYRVDMRLRPWGRSGALVTSDDAYLNYLQTDARLWERQALLKARVCAGDAALGRRFLASAQPLLFSAPQDEVRRDIHAMKLRTEAHLAQAGRTFGEVKLGQGSIRDAEFVAQYLQLVNGGTQPGLLTGNSLEALDRLGEAGILGGNDRRVLTEGYVFLRTVEHYLQILDYVQTNTLPAAPADLRYLARRLGFTGEDAAARFVSRYRQHSEAVRRIYLRHLAAGEDAGERFEGETMDSARATPEMVKRHLDRLDPSYAEAFGAGEVAQHAALAAQLDQASPVQVVVEPLLAGPEGASGVPLEPAWRITIVAYDFLGELSLICGLLFAHGLSIEDGQIFTYEPAGDEGGRTPDGRRKIVDVFTVRRVQASGIGPVTDETWSGYAAELSMLLRFVQAGEMRQAQGWLAKRAGPTMQERGSGAPALQPIGIEVDNVASPDYTVLRIEAADTPGFLYEFTNALALGGIHIAQVTVNSAGQQVHDTFWVTDARGRKVTDPQRERELRAAAVLVKHFTHLLPRSPNPEAALVHFNEFLGELFQRPSWPDEFSSLERPEVLDALARLLGVSEFLWDDFLRMQYEQLFPVVRDLDALASARSRADLASALARMLAEAGPERWRDQINTFKDREMFRIDMRHILGHTRSYADFALELTALAEVVIAAAVTWCQKELDAIHGAPLNPPEEGSPPGVRLAPARFAVFALGKAGGREMGFASDVELMCVYDGPGDTIGPRVISNAEYFEKLVVELTQSIRTRREGIFEIDLQLRPYGKAGSLAVALDSFRRYFVPGGPAWAYERQALVKLRPIAGDPGLANDVLALRDRYVYGGDLFDVAAMRAMRERQLRHVVQAGTVNAKFSRGGLADLEYVVQALQINGGRDNPAVRTTNTAEAIAALARSGAISAENAARLSGAHDFLLNIINALRMVRGNSRDLTVPEAGSEEFAFLSRRLGYGEEPARLWAALEDHMEWVQRLEGRLLG